MPKKPLYAQAFWKRLTKLSRYRPPPILIAIILLLFVIFLISGGVYLTFTPRETIMPYHRGLLVIYPGIHDQTLAEGIAVMLIYFLGTLGLILIHRSTKYRHNPRQAHMFIVIGITLLVVTLALIETILFYKTRF